MKRKEILRLLLRDEMAYSRKLEDERMAYKASYDAAAKLVASLGDKQSNLEAELQCRIMELEGGIRRFLSDLMPAQSDGYYEISEDELDSLKHLTNPTGEAPNEA